MNFGYHVNQLCKKARKNLHALARIAKYMDINKQRMLMKTFVSSQFSYCPLIWMFHNRKMEHRINSIHKRAMKLFHQDSHDLRFQELLAKDKSVSVHQKNLQLLAIEIFKSKTRVSLELMNSYCLSRLRESFFPCSQIVGSSTKLNKKFCHSRGTQNKN